jgi:hypothetical protein
MSTPLDTKSDATKIFTLPLEKELRVDSLEARGVVDVSVPI